MVPTVGAVALLGLDARPVRVECTVGGGLPTLRLVGLPDAAVREAGDRVRAAVVRTGLSWPQSRVVVNLAPAALRKNGAGFDLPVALSVLAATEQLPAAALDGLWAFGELGLDGSARPLPGALPVAAAVRDLGGHRLLVPEAVAAEAALVEGLEVVPVRDLADVVGILRGTVRVRPASGVPVTGVSADGPDLVDVRGQLLGRRAIEIAAAGGHHLLLAGPPGCGKSMLARRLPGLLPALGLDEALEVAAIHSVAGVRAPDEPLSRRPPLREPHATTSVAGLIGGGAGIPRPGEVSLSHHGVLFVDELLEAPRHVLDALRQPLESGRVTITRARAVVRYPARMQLVAATNPCPCGHLGDPRRACRCRPDQIQRYRSRLSGPLLDRIDLQLQLRPVERDALLGAPDGEDSASVRERVTAARQAMDERGALNRDASSEQLRRTARGPALRTLVAAVETLAMTARAFDRTLRVARTIADLDGANAIDRPHVDEALAYRLPPLEVPV